MTELDVVISMNAYLVLITVISMQFAEIVLDHSVANVIMAIKVMELHVAMLTNVLMGTIYAASMLLVQILLEATNVNAMLDTMVTVSIAVTSTNVLKVFAMSMQDAKIRLAPFRALAMKDTPVMVSHALTLTNARQMPITVM